MSLLNPKSIKFDIGGGREVTIETGKMARQADVQLLYAKAIAYY